MELFRSRKEAEVDSNNNNSTALCARKMNTFVQANFVDQLTVCLAFAAMRDVNDLNGCISRSIRVLGGRKSAQVAREETSRVVGRREEQCSRQMVNGLSEVT